MLPVGDRGTDSLNVSEKARLDVSAVGIWSPMERTFLDIRVVHPNSTSYLGKSSQTIYKQNEMEKKRQYNQRVIQVERANFTPLVFSTMGGMAPECTRYHKQIAQLIALRTKESTLM